MEFSFSFFKATLELSYNAPLLQCYSRDSFCPTIVGLSSCSRDHLTSQDETITV